MSAGKPVLATLTAEPTQLDRTRALAEAFMKLDQAERAYREAQQALDAAFLPWAAGRTINRDKARVQLVSTGFLPDRRIWE